MKTILQSIAIGLAAGAIATAGTWAIDSAFDYHENKARATWSDAHPVITVTGTITLVEDRGMFTTEYTVIRQGDGKCVAVFGKWGQVGDEVTVTANKFR